MLTVDCISVERRSDKNGKSRSRTVGGELGMVMKIVLYAVSVLLALLWALTLDGLLVVGSPSYAVPYPARRLCDGLSPGMRVDDAKAIIASLGRPDSLDYRNQQLVIASSDSGCLVDIDPSTNRISKAVATNAAIQF